MAVSGILGWLNIRGLGVVMILPDEIYAGVDTLVTVELTNRKRLLPSFLLRLTVCGETFPFALLPASGRDHSSLVHRFPVRGLATIDSAKACSAFPINFFVRCRPVTVECRFPVFPAPRPCPAASVEAGRASSGATSSPVKGYDGEVAKIFDYTGGEPMKLIHWRLSARHDVFKVKEMSATAQEPVILDIAALPGRDLEENLSCATYLVNRLVRGGRPVGLKLGERLIPAALSQAHRLLMLKELAVYGKD